MEAYPLPPNRIETKKRNLALLYLTQEEPLLSDLLLWCTHPLPSATFMTYELRHIRGIPYYLRREADDAPDAPLRVYTFELTAGRISEHAICIGTYEESTDTLVLDPDWRERTRERLELFRAQLQPRTRETLRQTIDKPEKSSQRRRTTGRAAAGAASAPRLPQ